MVGGKGWGKGHDAAARGRIDVVVDVVGIGSGWCVDTALKIINGSGLLCQLMLL